MADSSHDDNKHALTILQEVLWRLKVVRHDTVLSDAELISVGDNFVRGLIKPDPSPTEAVRSIIKFVGEDSDREGLRETPERFLSAMAEYCQGYGQDTAEVIKTFEDGAQQYDEMIVLKDVEFTSLCEHHIAPFFGRAHIGYLPKGKVIGLSKLARITDIFARRLQIQERLTTQIAHCIDKGLEPLGVGVVIEAIHTCIQCRGVRKIGCTMVTSAMLGAFKEKPEARAEFLSLVRNGKR